MKVIKTLEQDRFIRIQLYFAQKNDNTTVVSIKTIFSKKRNMFILSIVIFFAWHNSALKEKKKDRLIIKWPLTYSLFYACFSFLIQILKSHLLTTIIFFFLNAGMFGKQLLVTCNISRKKKMTRVKRQSTCSYYSSKILAIKNAIYFTCGLFFKLMPQG